MVWTVIPDSDIDPDSPVTTGLVTALRDNVTALANGDAGAPSIGQGALKTATGNGSLVLAQATGGSVTLAGGTYSLWTAGGAGLSTDGFGFGNADTAAGTIGIITNDLGGGTFHYDERYFQASPPYNLGDGDIPLFIFVIIENSTGDIKGHYVAPEAPWHYNGKTSITSTRKDVVSGKSYQQVKQIKAELMATGKSIAQAVTDKLFTYDVIADRLINDAMVEIELSQAIKNADMVDIPHPFIGNDLTGKSVIMLDPVSTEKLLALHEAGEDLNTLIHDGTLKINTSPLVRATPANVKAYGFTL